MFKERDEIKAKLDMTELNLKRKIIATHKLKLKKVILEIENAQNKLEKLLTFLKTKIQIFYLNSIYVYILVNYFLLKRSCIK